MIRRRRAPTVGDIIEIRTPKGLAYAQYTHEEPLYGSLIRILPGIYQRRPAHFETLAQEKERFYLFYALVFLVRQHTVQVVAHEEIPPHAQSFPLLRIRGGEDKNGGVLFWVLWDGEKKWRVHSLSPEQANLSIAGTCGHQLLVDRIVSGWEPKDDIGIPQPLPPTTPSPTPANAGQPLGSILPHTLPEFPPPIRHYLYFPRRSKADEAARKLRGPGLEAVVTKSDYDKNWLLLVTQPVTTDEDFDSLRERLEEIAVELGGDYDGWERPV